MILLSDSLFVKCQKLVTFRVKCQCVRQNINLIFPKTIILTNATFIFRNIFNVKNFQKVYLVKCAQFLMTLPQAFLQSIKSHLRFIWVRVFIEFLLTHSHLHANAE